jgi:hypothetical protein
MSGVVAALVSCYRFDMKRDKPKSPPGPHREKLGVGLARHEKPEPGQLQRWFVEFGGWVFALLLLTVVLVALYRVSGRESAIGMTSQGSASLTVIGAPKKVWAEGSSTKIQSVQVRVGNQGQSRADNVRVVVASGGGRSQLTGSAQIESGKTELFAGSVDLMLRPGQDLQVILECANCQQDAPAGLARP